MRLYALSVKRYLAGCKIELGRYLFLKYRDIGIGFRFFLYELPVLLLVSCPVTGAI